MDLYQELSEGHTDVALISTAKQMDNHTQNQHLGAEGCPKGLQLGWMTGPQGLQTSTLSPRPFFYKKGKTEFKIK